MDKNNNLNSMQSCIFIKSSQILVDTDEYQTLQRENAEYRREISILKGTAAQLEQQVLRDTMEIGFLIKENTQLKDELTKLRQEINRISIENAEIIKENAEIRKENAVLKNENIEIRQENLVIKQELTAIKKENAELKKENAELKKENAELKKDNVELKKEITIIKKEISIMKKENEEIKKDNYISKLIIAMQDLNSNDQLERELKDPFNNLIKDVRDYRVGECHYLYTVGSQIDSKQVLTYKKQIFRDHLLNISSEIKSEFEQDFGQGLIEEIYTYLDKKLPPNYVQIDQHKSNRITKWWTK
jgi:chromosome segregation ATPase